jgi:division protein CdvB (Snf7/Vps24/ESCRT-III family)
MDKEFINNPVQLMKNLMDDYAELKAENERLKREDEIITGMCNSASNRFDKIYQTLQEIKAIAESIFIEGDMSNTYRIIKGLKEIITKAEEE